MNKKYNIVPVDNPEEAAWGIIGRGLSTYNKQQVDDHKFERLCFVLQTTDEEIVGGILGEIYWGWLFIELLWLKEELRGQGYGHNLLTLAEDKARQQGAKNAYLDTFSFQVPTFYKQHGYKIFGELQNFPPGHQRYFLKKEL